jgi:signal transduction histidine kinase
MRLMKLFFLIFFLSVASIGSCTDAVPVNSSTALNTSSSNGTSYANLVSFVQQAVDFADKEGKDEALREFSNRTGSFVRGDLYIYAYDFRGTNIAHPFKPDWIGTNKLNVTDSNGVPYIKNLIKVARAGRGFTYFIFPNPAHDNRDEFKIGYAMDVDDDWWLGSGIYLSNMSANFSERARYDLVDFVDSAAKFARQSGKDKALKEFNSMKGSFIKDDLYVFAYDLNGRCLALPIQPNLVGANRIDAVDPNGVKFVRNMMELAREGSGFTYYIYPDPARNMTQRLKLTYVERVDDDWWLGAELYAR